MTEVKPEDERRALAQFALSIDGIENSCYPKPCRAVRTECIVFNVPSGDRVINSLVRASTCTGTIVIGSFNLTETFLGQDDVLLLDVFVLQEVPPISNASSAVIGAPFVRDPPTRMRQDPTQPAR